MIFMNSYLMGLDVGGTKIECALIDRNQNDIKDTIVSKRIPTNRDSGYENVLTNIANLCQSVCSEAGVKIENLLGIGIGLPGTVDPRRAIMINGNSAIFIEKDITNDLKKIVNFNGRVVCDNDASCFALAEVKCGVGLKYQEEFSRDISDQIGIGIILGTGVGGGIIIDGKILRGNFGGAGEIGHTELYTDGHPCYCGMRGCVERYLSGPAIETAFHSKSDSQLKDKLGSEKIFELAAKLDPLALDLIKEYRSHLNKFLIQLTNIFDPDYFVLGGGVSRQKDIYLGVEKHIKENSFAPHSSPKVYQHLIGDSAGVIGAAMLI